MSVNFEINAQPRTMQGTGASRRLRRTGRLPAIVYGGHRDPEMISLSHNELLKHLEREAFYAHILDLKIGEVITQVVVKAMQRHPARPFVLHVDFQRIAQDEKIKMIIPLHFLNEDQCKGIKAGGQVSRQLTAIEITCLPKDLPEFIEIDMTDLKIGSTVHLSDISLPAGVELAHASKSDKAVLVVHGARASMDDEPTTSSTATPAAAT